MFVAGLGLGAVGGTGSTLLAKHPRLTIAPGPAVARTLRALTSRARLPRYRSREPLPLGTFQLTYYWMAVEGAPLASLAAASPAGAIDPAVAPPASDATLATTTQPPVAAADPTDAADPSAAGPVASSGPPAVQLFDKHCGPIAMVSKSFAGRLKIEGAGTLADGRAVGIAGPCKCSYSPCYQLTSRRQKFGIGVHQRPLSPFRSVAVDPKVIAIGTTLYIPELDGVTMPGRAPFGGFVHDGCVVADDEGGGIRGKQLDLFTARKAHYFALQRQLHLKRVTVFDGRDRCTGTRKPKATSLGSI